MAIAVCASWARTDTHPLSGVSASLTARFFSPLGAQDFVKRSSVIEMNEGALRRLGPHACALALLEGLPGHAEAVRVRLGAKRERTKRGARRARRRSG